MMTKHQLTILFITASLFYGCNLFFLEDEHDYDNDPYVSESYEDNEYAEEEAYEKDVEEAQNEELAELAGSPELSIESIPSRRARPPRSWRRDWP